MDSSQGHPGGGGGGKGRQIAWIYKGLHWLKALICADPDVCKAVPTVAQLGIFFSSDSLWVEHPFLFLYSLSIHLVDSLCASWTNFVFLQQQNLGRRFGH